MHALHTYIESAWFDFQRPRLRNLLPVFLELLIEIFRTFLFLVYLGFTILYCHSKYKVWPEELFSTWRPPTGRTL